MIDFPALANYAGHERCVQLLSNFKVFRVAWHDIATYQGSARRPVYKTIIIVAPAGSRLCNHQKIKITVRSMLAPCAAAEKPDRLRVQLVRESAHKTAKRLVLVCENADVGAWIVGIHDFDHLFRIGSQISSFL